MNSARQPRGGLHSARILIVCQPTVDGVAVCVRDLVEAAVDVGYHVTVACPSGGELAAWVQQRGAVWERLEMRRTPHPSDVLAVVRLRRLARICALTHLHSSKAGAVGRLALASLRHHRPPSVFTPHGWSWLVGGRLAPAYRLMERVMIPVTTAVVAVSEEERSAGRTALGRRAANIRVIPNGVDISRFCPDGPSASRSGDPLVVSVGRLCHQRAPDLAVAALAMMRTPGVRLRLVGDGQDRAMVKDQATASGVGGRVELVGHHRDVAPDLRAADVVLIPSRYDGMALVLLEAMACGTAVVATAVSGASVLAGAGIVVGVDDPSSLAAAVDALLADPGRRRMLGRTARGRVEKEYPLSRSIAGTFRLWQDLGAVPAGSRPQAESRRPAAGELRSAY